MNSGTTGANPGMYADPHAGTRAGSDRPGTTVPRNPRMNRIDSALELAQAKAEGLHNIGQAAQLSAVSAKMIRHYESIGLIPAAGRSVAGYRLYRDSDLHRLRFIKRSRSLGFSIKQIETLLGLWDNRSRESAEVKRLALSHAAELADKIREMQAMQLTLEQLAQRCHGDDRPDCPILQDLAAQDDGAEGACAQTGAAESEKPRAAHAERQRVVL